LVTAASGVNYTNQFRNYKLPEVMASTSLRGGSDQSIGDWPFPSRY
jgi:hypothetical protein